MRNPLNVFRGVRAMVRITLDPTRLEEVFVLANLAEESPELARLVEEVRQDPRFARAMREHPRLGRVDQDALAALPEGTLGRAYADFMNARGLRHEDLELIRGERDVDFVRNHLRETHDLWHVATGFDTDVAGELGVQAFYLAQFDGPLPLVLLTAGMLNTLVRERGDARRRLDAIARGWLLGKHARPLFGIAWAARWEQPLAELRAEHGLDLARVDGFLAERAPERVLAAA